MVIDGIWEFAFDPNGKFPESFNSLRAVPGCFDAGNELFGRKGVGFFRRQVTTGSMVRLKVRGGLKLQMYWDGKLVASSVLAYTPLVIDFAAGNPGTHELVIATDNRSGGEPGDQHHEFYDFYGYGGIYDHVELLPVPDEIDHVEVLPLNYQKGTIKLRVECKRTPEKLEVSFDGGDTTNYPYAPELVLQVPSFQLWSPEHPLLHTVTINGMSITFGLRVVECRGTQLLLNGEPLKLIGYNRHESHPQFGAATPDALTVEDLRKIKAQGGNFIRGSHYPQKEVMLETCDRLGLLVWEETCGWGNRTEQLVDPVFKERQLEAMRLTIRRSFNHPCVILRGFLNECASNEETTRPLVTALSALAHQLDPTRPVLFASNRVMRDICFDLVDVIALNIYPGWYGDVGLDGVGAIRPELEMYAEKFPEKPLIISEIGVAAMMGNRDECRWSEDFQAEYLLEVLNCVNTIARYTGVAIWQYCDCKTYIYTQYHVSRPRGFNNKGVLNEYRVPKIAWKALTNTIKNIKKELPKC